MQVGVSGGRGSQVSLHSLDKTLFSVLLPTNNFGKCLAVMATISKSVYDQKVEESLLLM